MEGSHGYSIFSRITTRRRKLSASYILALVTYTSNVYSQDSEGSDSQWIAHDTPLIFTVNHSSAPTTDTPPSTLRFLINGNDVSDLVRPYSPTEWHYDSQLVALPSGDIQLSVFSAMGDEWTELDTQYFRVLSPLGFEQSVFSKTASLTLDAQLDSGGSGDGFAPDEKRYMNGSGYVGLQSQQSRGDFELQGALNLSAASQHENSLQYGGKGEHAPHVDLSDYIVTVKKGNVSISLGHTNAGNHPLLVSGLANRGLNANYKISSRFDFGVSVQNGSSIVGWENISGLEDNQHQILTSAFGVELHPSEPGKQRIEFSYLDGQTQSINDFGAGQITDAEKNDGWGMRYQANLFNQKLRIDSAYAQSRFVNTRDSELEQGDELVEVDPSTDEAWHVLLAYDLIAANYETPSHNFATTLQYKKQRADALYRSLAAYVSADTLSEEFSLNGNLQHAQWQWSYATLEDNIDNIPTIMKSGTNNTAFQFQFNVADWLMKYDDMGSSSSGLMVWPSININLQRVHQRALNNPSALESGFNGGSHLPDQQNKIADVAADWSIGQGLVGIAYNYSEQDNRQIGRENADFERSGWRAQSSYPFFTYLTISLSIGKAKNKDIEQQTQQYNKHGNFMLQWQLPKGLMVEGGYSENEDYNNLHTFTSNAKSTNLGLSQQWQWRASSRPITGQWFFRYSRQENQSVDTVFDFSTQADTWISSAGLTLSF